MDSINIYSRALPKEVLGYCIFLLQSVKFIQTAYSKDIIHFHVASNGSFYRKIVLFLISLALHKKTIIPPSRR